MRIRCDLLDTSDAFRQAFGSAVLAERARRATRRSPPPR
jgi:hypothetical protein